MYKNKRAVHNNSIGLGRSGFMLHALVLVKCNGSVLTQQHTTHQEKEMRERERQI